MAQQKPEISKSQAIRDFVTKYPDFSVDDVVSVLAKDGIKVSKDLVYVVKSQMKKGQETAPASTEAQGDVNKAEAIRAVLKGNREMKARAVVDILAAKGIEVTPNQVYFIKGEMKGKKKKAQKVVAQVATAIASPPAQTDANAVRTILTVKGWAAEIGGMKKLKALVDALSE